MKNFLMSWRPDAAPPSSTLVNSNITTQDLSLHGDSGGSPLQDEVAKQIQDDTLLHDLSKDDLSLITQKVLVALEKRIPQFSLPDK